MDASDDSGFLIPSTNPDMPLGVFERLREAQDRLSLGVFLGAGVSRLLGAPGWDELASRLIDRCVADENLSRFDLRVADILKTEGDPKKAISICERAVNDAGIFAVMLDELLHPASISETQQQRKQAIERFLIGTGALALTTNVDRYLDGIYPKGVLTSLGDERIENVVNRAGLTFHSHLIHVHGSVSDPDSLVVTVPGYLKLYGLSASKESTVLARLFQDYTILFVGYGLAEFHVLEYAITRLANPKREVGNHVALVPFIQDNPYQRQLESQYFAALGIDCVHYDVGQKNHEYLLEIISLLGVRIRRTARTPTDKERFVSEAASRDEPSMPERDALWDALRHDASLLRVFCETAKNPLWLRPMFDAGLLAPESNPDPERDTPGGEKVTRYWWVLRYLEAIAERIRNEPDDEIADLLLEIVRRVVKFKRDGKRIENTYTDGSMIRILAFIPKSRFRDADYLMLDILIRHEPSWSSPGSILLTEFLPSVLTDRDLSHYSAVLRLGLKYRLKDDNSLFDSHGEYISAISEHSVAQFLQKNQELIWRLAPVETISTILSVMREILEMDSSQFNFIWISEVASLPEKYHRERYQHVLVQSVRDLLILCHNEPSKTVCGTVRKMVLEMRDDPYSIIKRLAIHLLDVFSGRIYFDADIAPLFTSDQLSSTDCFPELFRLIERRVQHSDEATQKLLVDAITAGPTDREVPAGLEHTDHERRLWRWRWLHAIRDKGISEADVLFDGLRDEFGETDKLRGKNIEIGMDEEREPPYPIGMFDGAPAEISIRLKEWAEKRRENDYPHFLSDMGVLRKIARDRSAEFSGSIDVFADLPPYVLAEVISGIAEAVSKGETTNSDAVIQMLDARLASADSQSVKTAIVASRIVELFKALIPRTMSEDLQRLKQMATLSVGFADQGIGSSISLGDENEIDWANATLNSPCGQLVVALFEIAIRCRNLTLPDPSRVVLDLVHEAVRRWLSDSTRPLELRIEIGRHIPEMRWLDSAWLSENLILMFPDDDRLWRASAAGFIWARSLDAETFNWMARTGQFRRSLNIHFSNVELSERLMHYIALAFLSGIDRLENSQSVVRVILREGSANQISWLVEEVYRNHDRVFLHDLAPRPDEYNEWRRQQIQEFIRAIYDERKRLRRNADEFAELAANMLPLLVFHDSLSPDSFKVFQWAADNTRSGHEVWTFTRLLAERSASQPAKCVHLLLSLVERLKTFGLEQSGDSESSVRTVVRNAYKTYRKTTKDIASRICRIHTDQGAHFLNDLHERFDPRPRRE